MDKLKALLEQNFPNIDFDEEKKLSTNGILDSIAMVSIIALIAEEFDVVVTMEYMDPKNFESVETMWKMIEELQA